MNDNSSEVWPKTIYRCNVCGHSEGELDLIEEHIRFEHPEMNSNPQPVKGELPEEFKKAYVNASVLEEVLQMKNRIQELETDLKNARWAKQQWADQAETQKKYILDLEAKLRRSEELAQERLLDLGYASDLLKKRTEALEKIRDQDACLNCLDLGYTSEKVESPRSIALKALEESP
jgi:hypothetical protein